jgi:hypothetical protein
MGFYEARTSYGMYRNVVPLTKMSSSGTPLFQTPQTLASLSQEVEEHLKIIWHIIVKRWSKQ